jgi:hypothetical protein
MSSALGSAHPDGASAVAELLVLGTTSVLG